MAPAAGFATASDVRASIPRLSGFLLFAAACAVGGPQIAAIGGDAGGGGDADGGSIPDASSGDAPRDGNNVAVTSGLYYGACLPQLAFGDSTKVFNFRVEITPQGSGLSLRMTPLRLSPSRTPPQVVSASGTVGTAASGSDGTLPSMELALGTVTIPSEANPLSGGAVTIQSAGLAGTFTSGAFCARLSGTITMPVTLTLEPEQNICRFVSITEGAATPTFPASEFAQGSCP
jgi:hypothetical protein